MFLNILENRNAEISNKSQEVLWSIRGFYQTIWSFPLTNVKWHSVTWPYTMTTPYWSDFVPNSTFYRILSGSIEHLRRVWHADRGRLLLWTPGPVPLGLAYVLLVETNPFPNLSLFYRTMLFEYPSVLSRFCFWDLFGFCVSENGNARYGQCTHFGYWTFVCDSKPNKVK